MFGHAQVSQRCGLAVSFHLLACLCAVLIRFRIQFTSIERLSPGSIDPSPHNHPTRTGCIAQRRVMELVVHLMRVVRIAKSGVEPVRAASAA